MNTESLGVFLVVLGLVQVVLAGIFLRWNQPGKRSSAGEKKAPENTWWVWVGRFGAACCIAGVLIIVMNS